MQIGLGGACSGAVCAHACLPEGSSDGDRCPPAPCLPAPCLPAPPCPEQYPGPPSSCVRALNRSRVPAAKHVPVKCGLGANHKTFEPNTFTPTPAPRYSHTETELQKLARFVKKVHSHSSSGDRVLCGGQGVAHCHTQDTRDPHQNQHGCLPNQRPPTPAVSGQRSDATAGQWKAGLQEQRLPTPRFGREKEIRVRGFLANATDPPRDLGD